MNGTATIKPLAVDAGAQLFLALDDAVNSLRKLRDRVMRIVDEDAMDAVILKKAMAEDDGTGWKSWGKVKRELKRDGLW